MTDIARIAESMGRVNQQRFEQILRDLADEGLLYVEGPVLEPVGERIPITRGLPDNLSSTLPLGLELAKFEDQVLTVLRQVSQANRDDPGHARSDQFRHVMERQLATAVALLEEVWRS